MEPLICPQCGGQITTYVPGQAFTTCQYCSTTFLIEANKQKDLPVYEPVEESFQPKSQSQVIIGVMVGVFVVFGLVIFFASEHQTVTDLSSFHSVCCHSFVSFSVTVSNCESQLAGIRGRR